MATIDLMDRFGNLGSGGIRNNGTLDAEVMFQPSLRTKRTDFIQVKTGDSIVYKNMNGMSSSWNILSFYTGDAQGYYVSGIAGQTTPQSGVWTAQQDGYVRLFGSFPAGDNISVTMTDLAPDVEDYLAKYNAMNYRFLPNSIPKIVAHIQEYLSNHPIADSTTLQAVIDAAFESYMEEIHETADTYIAEAVPPAAAAAVDAAASPALAEITAKTAEAAESAREAGLSQQSAEMSEENALTYRNQAQQIKDSITAEVSASVLAAQEQATLAQESAQAADESADTAEQYVAQARAQAEAAAAQAQTASGYASDAQGYMQDASDFADNAAQSAATFTTDPTLTISGKAADAKATGDQLSALKSALTEISEPDKNMLYSASWDAISAIISFDGDNIIVTASSNGTYRTTSTRIDVRDVDAVTISWESKESTSAGTKPASIRFGNIVNDSVNWIQYVTVSPTTIDTSEIDTLIFALYVAQGQSSNGDYATFTKLQLEKGSVATEFSQRSKTAIDYIARGKINELQERIFPSVQIVDASLKVLSDTNLWEAGSISSSTGENTVQSKSIRLKDFIEVDPSKKLYFQAYYVLPDSRVEASETDNAHLKNPYVYQYREDFSFISRISPGAASILTGAELTLDSTCKYVRFAFYTDLNNSDISTIMPTTIFVDVVSGDMWLPPYYESYLSEKADAITHFMRNEAYNTTSEKYEKIYDPYTNLISFIFITDNHYTDPAKTTKYNQMHSPAIIKRLAEKINIPMVFDGGDVDHSGLWTNLFTVPLRQAFDGSIHYAVGNHEFLSRNTGTNLYYDMDSLNDNQIGSADHHYYYVDNPQLKLRIIVLASNMESQAAMGTGVEEASQVGYTTEQETWVNDVALATLPSGWNIIAFTHFFYGVNSNTGNPSLSHGSTILAALANNPAVIAVFQGHTHFDRIVKGHDSVAGSLPIIITSCDKNIPHTSESVYPVNRSTGTIYEQLMDVVVINRSTKTINLIRVGGKALDGINDNIGSETEIRTVTYGD